MRFVSTPAVLERFVSIEREILQIESSVQFEEGLSNFAFFYIGFCCISVLGYTKLNFILGSFIKLKCYIVGKMFIILDPWRT